MQEACREEWAMADTSLFHFMEVSAVTKCSDAGSVESTAGAIDDANTRSLGHSGARHTW